MEYPDYHYLFGGNKPWGPGKLWTASDDRVRGGKSQSHLAISPGSGSESVVFHGDLDITALGGAGFASQRSVQLSWDLAEYQGLSLRVGEGDSKKYTIVLKDHILPKRPDGREMSTISWEYNFEGSESETLIPWHELKPTYRGKPKPDAEPLNLSNVKRISIMCRSFFGEQEGPFKVELDYIAAVASESLFQHPRPQPQARSLVLDLSPKEKEVGPESRSSRASSWLSWFSGFFR